MDRSRQEQKPAKIFTPLKLADLMQIEFPANSWVVDQLLPMNGITILSAPPASFKTWVLLEIARCVASGGQLFGHFDTAQTGVLVIDEESGEPLLQARLKKLNVEAGLPIYFSSIQGFKVNEPEDVKRLTEFVILENIGLVIFDSLVRIHSGDENDATAMANVFNQLRSIAKDGTAILLIHHNRKGGGQHANLSQEMRGSSDILASLDVHLALSREQKNLQIYQTKNRVAEELSPFVLEISTSEDTLAIEYLSSMGPAIPKRVRAKEAILDLLSEHASVSQKEMLAMLKNSGAPIGERTLRDLLKVMESKQVIERTQGRGNTSIYSLKRELANI